MCSCLVQVLVLRHRDGVTGSPNQMQCPFITAAPQSPSVSLSDALPWLPLGGVSAKTTSIKMLLTHGELVVTEGERTLLLC